MKFINIKNWFIYCVSLIKCHMWLVELILAIIGAFIAIFSIFIAYPEYIEFKEKNDIQDINWNWKVEFVTQESSYKDYIWDVNTYNMFLLWSKDIYKWKWERVQVNGEYIDSLQRDSVEFESIIKWNQIYSLFYLGWRIRDTDGNFTVTLSIDWKSFSGTFVWNAADSKWIITWIKIN